MAGEHILCHVCICKCVSLCLPLSLPGQYLLLIFALFKLQFNFIFHKYGQQIGDVQEMQNANWQRKRLAKMVRDIYMLCARGDTSTRYFVVNGQAANCCQTSNLIDTFLRPQLNFFSTSFSLCAKIVFHMRNNFHIYGGERNKFSFNANGGPASQKITTNATKATKSNKEKLQTTNKVKKTNRSNNNGKQQFK